MLSTVSAMPGSRSSNNESEHKSPRESGDDSEDESEILEESPCGRWLKRKEEVSNQKGLSLGETGVNWLMLKGSFLTGVMLHKVCTFFSEAENRILLSLGKFDIDRKLSRAAGHLRPDLLMLRRVRGR